LNAPIQYLNNQHSRCQILALTDSIEIALSIRIRLLPILDANIVTALMLGIIRDEISVCHMNTQKQNPILQREPVREPINAARIIGMKSSIVLTIIHYF